MRYVPVVLATGLIIGAGVLHGLRTDRWGAAQDLGAAAARLDEVPLKVGDWEGRPIDLDARQLAIAETAGHLARRYVHRRTGEEMTVVVLCGRPGPISVHSPEVCYPGSGFSLTGERDTLPLSDGDGRPTAEFFKARFVKPGAVPEALDVLWAWKSDGPWAASTNPRLAFARAGLLYKIYVIRRLSRPDESLPQDAYQDFLRTFLPELERRL